MLDAKYFNEKTDELEAALKARNADNALIASVLDLSKERKKLLKETETMRAERNAASQEISKLKANAKSDPGAAKLADDKILSMRAVGDKLKLIEEQLRDVEKKYEDIALTIPNIPHASVPLGKDEKDNKEVRKWGNPPVMSFKPKDHVEIGESLKILDFERAGKMSGARFSLYLGAGASLERALIQFMLDLHTRKNTYLEVIPPFMVNRETLTGTGQLPKFEADLFKTSVAERELFLIPTAEVPLTNVYADTILEKSMLPKYLTAYSPCFRSEAGSYGKDTRGLIRVHQFQKVELVKLTEPEKSQEELEGMVKDAQKVLELLGVPYRTILLCTGDMGFSSTKTYDIEAWLPSQGTYREISSCSDCGDFQARRAKIRYRTEPKAKPQFVHTLNGSGLAVGRTFVAVLENFQDAEGNVKIPEVLHKYLDGASGFTRKGDELWITKG